MGLAGKVALVTGASRGIGRACAEALAEEGASVALCARNAAQLEDEVATLGQAYPGSRTLAIQGDMTRPVDIERVVKATVDAFDRLDILVNAAGASAFGPFDELPDEAWASAMELKYLGYVRCARAAVPHMRRVGGGRIVNIVGNGGRHPLTWHMPGSASNAALLNFTKNLADTLAPDNILVNAVNPGFVRTQRFDRLVEAVGKLRGVPVAEAKAGLLEEVPLRRPAEPWEIASAVVFLASRHAGFVTGTALTVDGGMSKFAP